MTKVLLDTDKAAVIGAVSGATVTDAGTPASDDKVLIQDTSDSDNLKYVNISDLPGGGVDVLSNVATARIIGRTTAGSGDSEELTAAATRTFLNVADGATVDQDLSALAPIANPTFTGTVTAAVGSVGSPSFSVTSGGIYSGGAGILSLSNGSAGVSWDGGALYPNSDSVRDLGKVSTNRWDKLYVLDTHTSTIELGHATDTTISRVSAGVIAVEGVTVLTTSSTNTVINKRNQPRVSSSASGDITPTKVDFDRYIRTAQAAAITISNPTMDIGEVVAVQLTDNATARAITFGTHYMALDGLALPTTTTVSKVMAIVLEKVTATKVLVSYVNEA